MASSSASKESAPDSHQTSWMKGYSFSANQALAWNRVVLDIVTKEYDDNPCKASVLLSYQTNAVFDSLNAINQEPGLIVNLKAPKGISAQAAVAGASYEILKSLTPQYGQLIDRNLKESLKAIPDGSAETKGVAFGRQVAQAILDANPVDEPLPPTEFKGRGSEKIGLWRPTPPDYLQAKEPDFADDTNPWFLESASQFRPGPPPALSTAAYTQSFNEVKRLGEKNSKYRTDDQTDIAYFWSVDTGYYTPVGHLNDLADKLLKTEKASLQDSALLLSSLNTTLMDALVACWETKFTYDAWRPVTAIREAARDGNPNTSADPKWSSLLVTPNHPDYASGHSVLAGAAENVFERYFGDEYAFSFTSPSLPGEVRRFDSFQEAMQEDAVSRVYGGVHFSYATTTGFEMGQNISNFILPQYDKYYAQDRIA